MPLVPVVPSPSSHPHTFIPSHPHTLTPSYPHTLTPSHPHTITECITVDSQKSAHGWSTLQVWVDTLLSVSQLTMKVRPCHVYSNSMQIIGQIQRNNQRLHTCSLRGVRSRLDSDISHELHLSDTITLPTPHSLTPAHTLPPWGDTIPSDNPGTHLFPFNR